MAPCRFCQLGKMKAAELDGRHPTVPSRKKRMQITAPALLMLTTLHYIYAMQKCLRGWMNLRKIQWISSSMDWDSLVACVRQLVSTHCFKNQWKSVSHEVQSTRDQACARRNHGGTKMFERHHKDIKILDITKELSFNSMACCPLILSSNGVLSR